MDAHLTALEEKISRVAALCEGLRAENAALRAELGAALKTRDEYASKLDAGRARAEAILRQLP